MTDNFETRLRAMRSKYPDPDPTPIHEAIQRPKKQSKDIGFWEGVQEVGR